MIRRDCDSLRGIAMAFFKRELGPVERFEAALKDKMAARQKLAARLVAAETVFAEKRTAAERLAVGRASDTQLKRAEAKFRDVEDRVKALRAELAEFDEQIVAAERALADATAQRERNLLADEIEAMANAIETAIPGFDGGAAALAAAITGRAVAMPEATGFSQSVEAVRREVRSAADLLCWELRAAAVRTRAGNTNVALLPPPESSRPEVPDVERQPIYTLSPLQWREGDAIRRVPAFARVGLPKALLPAALRHQHVDHLNARRVQTLMQVHGSETSYVEPAADDSNLVDLDALATGGEPEAKADVA
jgi:hypothetical protein